MLLACRQWDPHGLARRLPSCGAGARLGAPLLPWRMQCPARVWAALAAGLGGWGRCWVLCLSRSPPPVFPALRVAGRPVGVSLTLARWYAIPCGLCVPRAWSGCPSGIHRLPFACVCACALAVSAPFLPPLVGAGRAPQVVPAQCASRAVPCDLCPSAFPASVPCAVWLALGGGGPVPFPPCLTLGRVPPCGRACASWVVRRRGGPGGGCGLCAAPPEAWPGGPEGQGVAPPRSGPLPSLGGHQSGCHRRHSVHGGRGLHTVQLRVCVSTPRLVRGEPLCAGAGPLACRGHCRSTQVLVWGRVACRPGGVLPPGAAAPFFGGGGGGAPLALGGVVGRRPLGPPPVSRRLDGGGVGERKGGGGSAVVPRRPPSVPWPRPSAAAGGWLVAPGPEPPHGQRCGAARPSLPRARSGLFGSPGCWVPSSWPPVGQSCVEGAGPCAAPRRGLRRGAGGCSASVCPSTLPGRASSRAAPALPCPPYCSGSRPRATARMRSAGCPCAPR